MDLQPKLDNPYNQGKVIPVFVDADIVAYSCAFSKEVENPKDAEAKVDELIAYIEDKTCKANLGQYEFYLTGQGNFRNDIAKTAVYKGNRKDKAKPEQLEHIQKYLVGEYGAVVTEGEETDDAIATRATEESYDCIIASIDKDFLQIPCWHFNFRRNEWYKPTQLESNKLFYSQILTGDAVDNIIGLHRVGPKKAEKMLEGKDTEEEMYKVCLEAYGGDVERVLENARLLWLRRDRDIMWTPPVGIKDI
jgi:hypothetical protein